MRIGIIGLGRIGAFHAGNLAALDAVDELVVTDAVPGVAEAVAAKFSGRGGGRQHRRATAVRG